MMKKLTFLSLVTLFMISAMSLSAQSDKAAKALTGARETIALTPEGFQENAENLLGKEVEIKGMVIHVCKHGGKKMFLIGEDPDVRVKITASDKVSSFEMDLEGSIVIAKGIIEPMEDEKAIAKEEDHDQDDDHKNYYHRPQYSLSCLAFKVINE